MKKITILIGLLIILLFAGFLFFREGNLPVNKKATETTIFMINPGQDLDSIINELSDAKLIRNRVVFFLVVKQLGIERKIQAGDFRLSQSMTAKQIAEEFTHGSIDIWLTVPEGLRKEEIAELVAQKFDIKETEFNSLATEGYLFPDTYLIPRSASAQGIIDIMEANFNSKFTPEISNTTRKNKLTNTQVLILASLVEKETKFDEDRQKVADVLLRRYVEDYPLEVDVTIQYALGYQANEKRWWKSFITFDDLEIDSPYNNYKNVGFPPAPICNPGVASIRAAAQASGDTPYRFYLADDSGHVHFGKTFEEHEANIQKYLR